MQFHDTSKSIVIVDILHFMLAIYMRVCFVSVLVGLSGSLDTKFDHSVGVLHASGSGGGAGLLRLENPRKHVRFMNLAEKMDSLEFRKIDAIPDQQALMDEVSYLRSFAVEECRSLVCSHRGKARFSSCADSQLSESKECRPDCQDHLRMWVFHRCYMVEAFDCAGNIGPGSLDPVQLNFNQQGPQTLAEFTTNVNTMFESKGVNCQCCDFSDVVPNAP